MIKIICLGKVKERYLKEAIADYLKRINKYHKLEIVEIEDEFGFDQNKSFELEKNKLMKKINEKEYIILLDVNGKELTSVELSAKIDKIMQINSNIVFIIGSSNGVHQEIKERANHIISFSKMTFPHQLFRVLLLEQIYRSFKINNNENYHK